MAKNNESATILLVSKNPSVIEATRTTLAEQDELKLLEKEITQENLLSVISQLKPDVVLLDFGFQHHPFYLVDKLASDFPKSAVVALLSEAEMVNLDRVVLSGARAFLQYPFQSEKLVIIIKRVLELLERNQTTPTEGTLMENIINAKNTYTVFSPKGGAGTTTVAINLAISLNKALNEDVLLIDGKHLFGHVALFLNLFTGNSITDLIAHAGKLDQQLIKQVVEQHASGVYVLPSPNSISQAQGIKPENLFTVVQSLQEVFPNIIIDGGNYLDENTVTYMDSSDKILLVLNPDLASMRDARQFLEIASTLSYPKEKMLFLLNMVGRKADVKSDEIESILKMKVFGKIPADENLALSCLNEGVPIVMKKGRHPISRAYTDITKDLLKLIQSPEGK
ncbi:AAA family ATPase [Chloroflexota bacterium]|nr:AAA family ATPase [Chloroflexota bacterium]